jgi:tRNA-dihydrouridine synthase
MDGITDAVYRYVARRIFDQHTTQDTYMCRTEFMSSDGYLHNWQKLVRHLLTYPCEYPYTIAQIYWDNADTLTYVAQEIDRKYDFAGIELNIGCPSPKVMSCGWGVWMLKDKHQTLNTIRQIATSIGRPFSIKTRIGLSADDRQEQYDFILASAEYCQTITIHGRTYRQSHSGSVDRDFIKSIKQALGDRIRVFGNGGIKSYQDACQHQDILDGIMIGQACIGNPWILTPYTPTLLDRYETIMLHLDLSCLMELYFQDLCHFDHDNQVLLQPDLQEMMTHRAYIDSFVELDTCHSVIEFRKHLFNYIHGLPGNKELKMQVANLKNYHALVDAIKQYFDTLLDTDQDGVRV